MLGIGYVFPRSYPLITTLLSAQFRFPQVLLCIDSSVGKYYYTLLFVGSTPPLPTIANLHPICPISFLHSYTILILSQKLIKQNPKKGEAQPHPTLYAPYPFTCHVA